MESKRYPDYSILIVLSPLLLPLTVLAYITLSQHFQSAPARSVLPRATSIAWTGSLDWVLGAARIVHKPVMVDFYVDG